MSDKWQLHQARTRFGEVVNRAIDRGPQILTRRGVEAAVVLSWLDYRKMLFRQKKLSEFFRESPPLWLLLDLSRSVDSQREDVFPSSSAANSDFKLADEDHTDQDPRRDIGAA